MNGKELLMGLSYIDRKYIEESEKEVPVIRPGTFARKAPPGQMARRRFWLIAAAAVMALLLVGCAAVVYSRIQMKMVQHHVPATVAATVAQMPVQETQPVRDPLTSYYPQSLPEGYQMGEGSPSGRYAREIVYRNAAGTAISFRISTHAPVGISPDGPVEEVPVKVSGYDGVMQVAENGGQALGWHNEAEGYYVGFYTGDTAVDLAAMAESVDYGPEIPVSFLCREGEIWEVWYPRQLPEGYVCRSVAPFSNGTQIIDYTNMEHGISYAVSLTRDFLEQATEPPQDPYTWDDLTVGGQPARMMTTPGQRILYWHNGQEGFYGMLSVSDPTVDILALAESVAPGAPMEVSDHYYLGPDYTIELEQEKTAYVGWEPVYPQWVPEGFEIAFVSDPAYGHQMIRYENPAGEQFVYTFYFRLGQWGRTFDGMGQPEEVTINGNPGYHLGNALIWTEEAKGFGFEVVGITGADLVKVAESVGVGAELEPTFADKTRQALEALGDYRISQLPEGMVEDAVTGMPPEGGGYGYVRRWYANPDTNAQVYLEYEPYAAEPPVPVKKLVQNYMGERPMEFCTIHDCVGAVSQDDGDATIAWLLGNGKHGVRFKLISGDYSGQELLEMAQSVQAQQRFLES